MDVEVESRDWDSRTKAGAQEHVDESLPRLSHCPDAADEQRGDGVDTTLPVRWLHDDHMLRLIDPVISFC